MLQCYCKNDESLSTSAAYDVLGIDPTCTPAQLKAAFRAKVKEFHPDVNQEKESSDIMIRRVIRAYEGEIHSMNQNARHLTSLLMRLFVLEKPVLTPVLRKHHKHLSFHLQLELPAQHLKAMVKIIKCRVQLVSAREVAFIMSHLLKRTILEELLDSIIDAPYDTSAEEDFLYSLLAKAKFENNRCQKPKKQSNACTPSMSL